MVEETPQNPPLFWSRLQPRFQLLLGLLPFSPRAGEGLNNLPRTGTLVEATKKTANVEIPGCNTPEWWAMTYYCVVGRSPQKGGLNPGLLLSGFALLNLDMPATHGKTLMTGGRLETLSPKPHQGVVLY